MLGPLLVIPAKYKRIGLLISSGSIVAHIMSLGAVPAGGLFATLQSGAMGGYGAAIICSVFGWTVCGSLALVATQAIFSGSTPTYTYERVIYPAEVGIALTTSQPTSNELIRAELLRRVGVVLHLAHSGFSLSGSCLYKGLQDGDFRTAELIAEWLFDELENPHSRESSCFPP